MVKKLCLIAGLAGLTGCYTATPVRTMPVVTPTAPVIYATPTVAPVLVAPRPAWGYGPYWGHGWGGFHRPHFHGRCR